MTVPAGKYNASLNEARGILRSAELFSTEGFIVEYPPDLPSIMRKLSYREQWEKCAQEGWFNFRLLDGSLLQFRRSQEGVSYSYLETPLSITPFEEFAHSRVGDDWLIVEEELRGEYELYITSDLSEKSVTPVRYDFEPELYRAGVHPAGHFHFGIGNQIRICATKILNPMSFVLFILRQFYPNKWEALLHKEQISAASHDIRECLDDVDAKYLCEADRFEMMLT